MEKVTQQQKVFKRGLIDQTLMIIDGNLLTANLDKGSYIPDRLIDQVELITELTQDIFSILNTKDKEKQGYILELLRNHRRGSNASTCSRVRKNSTKENIRRSWGPDDTWSQQYVDNEVIKNNKNETKYKKDLKSRPRSTSQMSSGTHALPVERKLSACQPLTRYQNRSKRNNSFVQSNEDVNNNISTKIDHYETQNEDNCNRVTSPCDYRACNRQLKSKERELKKMVSWLSNESYDYVHSEQAHNLNEVELFLDVLKSSQIPVQMSLKVNSPTDINFTYQFLPKFKDEFMILNLGKTHCMVMRAF